MASFKKLDKKQVPQVIGLGAASAGLFGYFIVKMIVPTASAATAAPTAKPAMATTATPAAATATTPGTPAASAPAGSAAPTADAPAPTPAMRNPFVPLIGTTVDATVAPTVIPAATPATPKPVRVATANTSQTSFAVPAGLGPLPAMSPSVPSPAAIIGQSRGSLAPMPVAAPMSLPPGWTVTGVINNGSQNVAILRNGDERAFVHPGDFLGSQFRVIDVTAQSVVLRRGTQRYTLPLGTPSTTPASKGSTAVPPPPTTTAPTSTTATTTGDPAPDQEQFQAIMQKLNTLTGAAPTVAVPTDPKSSG
jgi:hypothetical protein